MMITITTTRTTIVILSWIESQSEVCEKPSPHLPRGTGTEKRGEGEKNLTCPFYTTTERYTLYWGPNTRK